MRAASRSLSLLASCSTRPFSASARVPGILERMVKYSDRIAIVDGNGSLKYRDLLSKSALVSQHMLLRAKKAGDGKQPRAAYLYPRNRDYVIAQTASWQAGFIGVPLSESYPASELRYFLEDSKPSIMLAHPTLAATAGPLCQSLDIPLLTVGGGEGGGMGDATLPPLGSGASLPPLPRDSNPGGIAYLIYTSGTTGKPKGVLTQHSAMEAQISALSEAWEWSERDRILHVLPLHHVHGIMGVLNSALWNGAAVEMLPKFDAAAVWAALTRPTDQKKEGALSLFMAVPTVYALLVRHFEEAPQEMREAWMRSLKGSAPSKGGGGGGGIRLMVSGSAALPEPLMKKWKEITRHTLLERFGMTEFGLALSNSYRGERIPNCVGKPLPGFEARIVQEEDAAASASAAPNATSASASVGTTAAAAGIVAGANAAGELQIRGRGLFTEYWGRPAATTESFTSDGWYKTGDSVQRDEAGNYFILGRLSADIIKSGGYKLSALEIERLLLDHPDIAEIAVFGVPDATFGERVAAMIMLKPHAKEAYPLASPGSPKALVAALRAWAGDKMAAYKLPSVIKIVESIPRNAMHKVNKKELKKNF